MHQNLSGEVLGSLIRSTGIEKDEIDGFILSSSMTSAGNVFWSQASSPCADV